MARYPGVEYSFSPEFPSGGKKVKKKEKKPGYGSGSSPGYGTGTGTGTGYGLVRERYRAGVAGSKKVQRTSRDKKKQ